MPQERNEGKGKQYSTLVGAFTIGAVVLYTLFDGLVSGLQSSDAATKDEDIVPSNVSSRKKGKKQMKNCEAPRRKSSKVSSPRTGAVLASGPIEVDHSICNPRFVKLRESIYIRPKSMYFEQNGITKRWDMIDSFDVVCGLAYDVQKDAFLFVKQFRAPVYNNRTRGGNELLHSSEMSQVAKNAESKGKDQIGVTYELCAGLMDKDGLSPKETMKEEFYEECGYNVPLSKLNLVANYRNCTGVMGNLVYVFTAFISDSMRVNLGGGDDTENIELVWVPLKESKRFIMDPNKDIDPGLKFAVFWFYDRFRNLCRDLLPLKGEKAGFNKGGDRSDSSDSSNSSNSSNSSISSSSLLGLETGRLGSRRTLRAVTEVASVGGVKSINH